MTRWLPIEDLHPTQPYLSSEKLRAVVEWFDFDDPNYGTPPAFEHAGEWYLADGHARGFAAHLAGAERLHVDRNSAVRAEHDFELYLWCIDWCAEAGIGTVADLSGRVVEPDTYEELWVERCQRAEEQ